MKSLAECRSRLRGLFNIAVTPFQQDGSLDFRALAENLEWILDLGYDGVLIGGTYGEFPTMSVDERAGLFRHAMSVVGDRCPVMLCAAGSDVRVVRELTVLASQLGGLPMITPPFVSEVTDDQMVAFFREMAPLSRTGVLIYNAPGIGITLPAPLIETLSEIEGVVGIKQGDLNPAVVDVLANRLHGKIRLFCASDLAFPGPIMAGFDGVSSTNSCALPEIVLKSYRALEGGDLANARELQRRWYPFRELARRFGQPQTVKAAMRVRGVAGGFVRAPLTDLDGAPYEEVAAVIGDLAAGIAEVRQELVPAYGA